MTDDVMLTSPQVSALFKKGHTWFASGRVRRELYKAGFPRPKIAGRWSKAEVIAWINGTPPPSPPPAGPPDPANDWSKIIAARGAALDKGIDPDTVRKAE